MPQEYLCVDQPVFVSSGVLDDHRAVIVRCDVLRRDGERHGVTWINHRQADVVQRFPGYDPSFEWVFLRWSVDL